VDADVLLVALAQAIDQGEVKALSGAVRIARAYASKVTYFGGVERPGSLLPVPPLKDRPKAAFDSAKRAIGRALSASPKAHPDALIRATRASLSVALHTLNPGTELAEERWRANLIRRCVDKRVPRWDATDVLGDALIASGVSPRLLEKFLESTARASRARTRKSKTL
jgi:hypothetical protein